jgi:hypothetical protein
VIVGPSVVETELLRPQPATSSFSPAQVRVVVAAVCLQARFGATLTPEGVIVHGLRRKTIAWDNVTAIRAEEYTTNRVVAIYEFGHRRTRLRYPTSGGLFGDSEFDDKLRVIQGWWTAHSRGLLAGGKVPGGKVPGGKVPGGKVPGGKVPGGKVPGGKVPGARYPEDRRGRSQPD